MCLYNLCSFSCFDFYFEICNLLFQTFEFTNNYIIWRSLEYLSHNCILLNSVHVYWQSLSLYQLIMWHSLYHTVLSAKQRVFVKSVLTSTVTAWFRFCFAWFLSLSFLMCLSLLLRWVTPSILLVLVLSPLLCVCVMWYMHVCISYMCEGRRSVSDVFLYHRPLYFLRVSHWT